MEWTPVLVALIGTVGTVLGIMVETSRRNTKHAIDHQSERIDAVETNVAPLANGYANDTRSALRRIEDAQHETRKDIGGLRQEVRQVRDDVAHERQNIRSHERRLDAIERKRGGTS